MSAQSVDMTQRSGRPTFCVRGEQVDGATLKLHIHPSRLIDALMLMRENGGPRYVEVHYDWLLHDVWAFEVTQ